MHSNYEVERKFLMRTMPELPVKERHVVRQAYIYASDTCEMRLMVRFDRDTYDTLWPNVNKAKLTIKMGNGKVREETEIHLTQEQVTELCRALPNQLFITKYFTIFDLGNGLTFEFSSVDPNLETGFLYGEIEFPSVDAADEYEVPKTLLDCIKEEVTDDDTYQMKNYWRRTRLGQ